ncbi:hypothetical protein NPIL_619881 [Nephila pilipes]|uniref:Uncharacterized protein n=1 Tax=Nephila pilipes TaxID=299642 RepID=A0A8X6PM10_NEPPI|nr:hypothetical protein NPIL_619881 [Nephila pilipes]
MAPIPALLLAHRAQSGDRVWWLTARLHPVLHLAMLKEKETRSVSCAVDEGGLLEPLQEQASTAISAFKELARSVGKGTIVHVNRDERSEPPDEVESVGTTSKPGARGAKIRRGYLFHFYLQSATKPRRRSRNHKSHGEYIDYVDHIRGNIEENRSIVRAGFSTMQVMGQRQWVLLQSICKTKPKDTDKTAKLIDIPIRRHVKIRADATFDLKWKKYLMKEEEQEC